MSFFSLIADSTTLIKREFEPNPFHRIWYIAKGSALMPNSSRTAHPVLTMLRCSIFAMMTALLSILILGAVSSTKKKVLMVAPNYFPSHFALNRKLAEELIAKDWVQHVHILIIERSSLQWDNSLLRVPKLTLQYFNPREQEEKMEALQSFPQCDAWGSKNKPRRIHMSVYGNNFGEELILKFARRKKQIQALRSKRFDVGIAEVSEYAAFPLFHLIGVRHMVATLSMNISSAFYEIMDKEYFQKIVHQGNIPEFWTTMCDDHLKVKHDEEVNSMHITSVQATKNVYAEMDEKFAEIYVEYNKKILRTRLWGKLKAIVRKPIPEPIPNYRTMLELFHETAHFFVNSQPFLDFPMPATGFPQKVTFIGGIAIPSANSVATSSSDSEPSLNDIIQMAEKKNGLILVSFGTMAKFEGMREYKMKALLGTFSEDFHNFLFIVKSARDFRVFGENIVSKQWVPQKELLAYSRTKLFFSHCGMNSVLEAAHYGVPLLCMPLFSDQHYNAEAMAKQGAAVVLDKDRICQDEHDAREEISAKLHSVLNNSSYKEKMMEIQREMDKTQPADEFLKRMQGLD